MTAYARPKKFDGMDVMQEDMVKLIQQHGEDLKDIAEFFEKNNKENHQENLDVRIKLDSGRNYVTADITDGKIDYKKIEKKLFQVLDSFPGIMEIYVSNYGVNFILEGNLGGQYVELRFLFQDAVWREDGAKQSENYFETAPRWIYHYSPPREYDKCVIHIVILVM